MRRTGAGCWIVVLLVLASVAAPQERASPPAIDDVFVRALAAARNGDPDDVADSAVLRAHPLLAYLEAERIVYALAHADGADSEADAGAAVFLRRYSGLPVARGVRYEWAVSLARRALWQPFLEQYDVTFDDDRLYCQYLGARIALERIEGIAPLIVERFMTPRRLPGECEPVFQWLRAEGALTDDHVEQRVRLLLANGQPAFARVIAARLPEERAEPLLRWAALLEQPAQELERFAAAPSDTLESAAVLAAWSRLARDSPDAAIALHESLQRALAPDADSAAAATVALALGLAWDRRPEALTYFAAVPADRLDDYALGWQTRAALWAGDWQLAGDGVAAMSSAQREQAIWRYWTGRIVEERDGRREAQPYYEALLADDNFYAGLAAAHLRRRLRPTLDPLPRDDALVATLARRPALVRANALFDVGLPVAALREWRYGVMDLDDAAARQTVHLAADWARYDLAVAVATRLNIFHDYPLLYPTPYGDIVTAATRATGLRRELVYGVIRQESLFRADAVSNAGARGLMQLTPGTAARHAEAAGTQPTSGDLLDPALNVALGAAELARLLELFDGRLPVALAAYNAGPNAAERWLPTVPMDADVWIENIPFNETRAYVRRVLWHSLVFRWLDTRRAQDTRDWLERI